MERLYKAFTYSMAGLKACYKNELAFRQEIWLLIIIIPLVVFIPINYIDKIILLSSYLLILLVEIINSAIETIIDRISKDKHELSKIAKDLGSASVLLSIIICLINWAIILYVNFI